jgi:hypothetical protein
VTTDPVYQEDIEDQEEEILNVWKMAHSLYERMMAQPVPIDSDLVAKLTETINLLAAAHKGIQDIKTSWAFPRM